MNPRSIACLLLGAGVLPAQWPFNLDFNGNSTAVVDLGGRPALLVYNLVPRTGASAPHHLANLWRPQAGILPLRIQVEELWLWEPQACALGHTLVLGDTARAGGDWSGAMGTGNGFGAFTDVAAGLQWTPGPGSTHAMGVLDYLGGVPGCAPAAAPRSPAFVAVCSWEVLPPPQVVQFTGFETGDFGEFADLTGDAFVQDAVVRSGRFAMRSLVAGEGYAHATLTGVRDDGLPGEPFGLADMYASFWFRYDLATSRSRIAEVGGVHGATKARLELEVDRRLSIFDFDHTNRFYTVRSLAPGTWYHLEWRVGTGNRAGTELAIDGVVEISVGDAKLSDEPTGLFHVGRSSRSGGPIDFYYDDVVVAAGGFAGAAGVVLLRPDGPGAESGWTGGYLDVDDWPHDGDASSCLSAGRGSAITMALEDSGAAGVAGRVLAVKPMAVLRRESGSAPCALRLRRGADVFDSLPGDGGASWRLRARVFADDPVTGFGWKALALDAIEVGAVSHSSSPGRMTSSAAAILVAPR